MRTRSERSSRLLGAAAPRESGDAEVAPHLAEIVSLVRAHTGFDISKYKRALAQRGVWTRARAARRGSIASYVRYLGENPHEAQALVEELLVGVSGFFRDPDAFAHLASAVGPRLAAHRGDAPFRGWVAGCAAGQEAYSVAMVLVEEMAKASWPGTLQLFATDVSGEALRVARAGSYDASAVAPVSAGRLARFFDDHRAHHTVTGALRTCVLFARHDVASDPPFRRLDVVCCRNVLIYFEPAAQRQILGLFHHALVADGLLFLGSSESADEELFELVDAGARIYRRRAASAGDRRWPLPWSKPRAAAPVAVDATEALASVGIAAVDVDADLRISTWSEAARRVLAIDGEAPASLEALARHLSCPPLLEAARAVRLGAGHIEMPVQSAGRALSLRVARTPSGLILVAIDEKARSRRTLRARIAYAMAVARRGRARRQRAIFAFTGRGNRT